MHRHRLALVVLVIGWVLAATRAAHAEDALLAKLPKVKSADAHAHVVAGNAHYRSHELEKALDEYKLALQIEPADIILYNMGQCNRGLQRWEDAIWVYRRFLDHAKPEPPLVERVTGFINEAEQKLAAQKAAEQRLAAEPSRAPSEATTPSPPAAHTAQLPAPVSPRTTTRIVAGEAWYRDSRAWVVTGIGVVGIGVGSALLSNASHLDDQGNQTTSEVPRNSLRARASTRRVEGYLVGGTGVVATVLGVAMLIVHPGDHEEPTATSWHIGVMGHGIAVAGSF